MVGRGFTERNENPKDIQVLIYHLTKGDVETRQRKGGGGEGTF